MGSDCAKLYGTELTSRRQQRSALALTDQQRNMQPMRIPVFFMCNVLTQATKEDVAVNKIHMYVQCTIEATKTKAVR